MDQEALIEAVENAWHDLSSRITYAGKVVREYNDLADRTLQAFEAVKRQIAYVQTDVRITDDEASAVLAELRREPAGQLTVAFRESKALDQTLGRSNEAVKLFEDARDLWDAAKSAARDAGCDDSSETFELPDEYVETAEIIDQQARFTQQIDELKEEVEAGARQVDERVSRMRAAKSAQRVEVAALAPVSVVPVVSSPPVQDVTDTGADPYASMLADVASPASPSEDGLEPVENDQDVQPAAGTPSVPHQADPVLAGPPKIVDDTEEDESLAPPVPPSDGMGVPVKREVPANPGAPTSKPPVEVTPLAAKLGAQVGAAMAVVIEGYNGQALDPNVDPAVLEGFEKDVLALQAALYEYDKEIRHPDPELCRIAEGIVLDMTAKIQKAKDQRSIKSELDAVNADLHRASDAMHAWENAADPAARASTGATYKAAIVTLMQSFAALKETGKADPEFLTGVAEAIDAAGWLQASIANEVHGDVHALAGDAAHYGEDEQPSSGFNPAHHVKAIGGGIAVLVVIVAGLWIGVGGGGDAPAAVVVAPPSVSVPLTTIPAPVQPVAPGHAGPAPTRGASPTASGAASHAKTPVVLPAEAVAQAPARVAPHPAASVHHAAPVQRVVSEQAQLDTANATLNAWAKARGEQ